MASTKITDYLSQGLAAARPATPANYTGTISWYYATDTGVLSYYSNGAWHIDAGQTAIGQADFQPTTGVSFPSGFFLGRTFVVPNAMNIASVKIPIQSAAASATIQPVIYAGVLGGSLGSPALLASGPAVTGAVIGVQTFPLTTPLAATKDQVLFGGVIVQVAAFNVCQRAVAEAVLFSAVASGTPNPITGLSDQTRTWASFWLSA